MFARPVTIRGCRSRYQRNRLPAWGPGVRYFAFAAIRPIPARGRFFLRTLLLLTLIWAVLAEGYAQAASPTEYQIKAAFIYNFAKFVEWPPKAFPKPNSPIIIGVLGENVFGQDLAHTIRNKTIDQHPFEFLWYHSIYEATNCQILFISRSEKKQLPQIIAVLHEDSILTVSEMDHFTESGGMINFVIQHDRVRFQINDANAKKASLKISSKLLELSVPAG